MKVRATVRLVRRRPIKERRQQNSSTSTQMNTILCRSCPEHEEKTVPMPVISTVRGLLRRRLLWLDRQRLTGAGTEKTDKADALRIAHIMRTGWFRQAHIKSEAATGRSFC